MRRVTLEQLRGYTHEKEQRLRKLRVMNGSGTHDLISICIHLPLTNYVINIWPLGKLTRTHNRCGVAISKSPAFRND